MIDCTSDGYIDAYWDAYTAYWWVHAIDYWQDANVKCGRHGVACSVTEAQSHDKGRGERSVTGVHGSATGI